VRVVGWSPHKLKEDPYASHSLILSLLGKGGGRRALDVGAADGFLTERLTASGWTVTALERDPVQADRIRGKCRDVIVADLADGAVPLSGPFDAIVYGDVLEHLNDPLPPVVSVHRHLARGGAIVVSVPNVAHLWVRLSLLAGRFDYADRGILDRTHVRFFTLRTFLAFVGEAGLAVESLHVTPVPLPLVVPRRFHGAWLPRGPAPSGLPARGRRGGPPRQAGPRLRPPAS